MSDNTTDDKDVTRIPLEKLRLDPLNPRLPKSAKDGDDNDRISYLVSSADVEELMGSIGSSGYFEGEPLLVAVDPDDDGKYIVVEGNCRLAACLLLQDPGRAEKRKIAIEELAAEATEKPNEIPCIVYQERKEILKYLGYRHVKGPHAWGALQKAVYLKQLRASLDDNGLTNAQKARHLAREIGSKPDYVEQLLTALGLYDRIAYDDFFELGLTEKDINFSLLSTAISYTHISHFLGLENRRDMEAANLDPDRLKQLTEWMFVKTEGASRVGESRKLKSLAAVVSHPEALAKFAVDNLPLDEALNWTSEPYDNYRDAIKRANEALQRGRSVIYRVKKTEQHDLENISELVQLLRSLKTEVSSRLEQDDEFGDL